MMGSFGDLRNKAREEVDNGLNWMAVNTYETLLKAEPDLASTIYSDLAVVFCILGKPSRQAESLKKALELNPYNAKALINLGVLSFSQGDYSKSESCLLAALDLEPSSTCAIGNLSTLYLKIGNIESARRYLEDGLTIDSCSVELLGAALSIIQEELQDWAQSLQRYFDTYSEVPLDILHKTAAKVLQPNEPSLAMSHYKNSLHNNQMQLDVHIVYSRLLHLQGGSDEAIEHLIMAITMFPGNPRLLLQLGYCLQDIGLMDDAILLYDQVLDLNPKHVTALNLKGCCYRLMKQEYKAIDVFRQALRLCSYDPQVLSNYASALRNVGDHSKAIQALRRIVDADPDDENAFYALMFTYSILSSESNSAAHALAQDYWAAKRKKLASYDNFFASASDINQASQRCRMLKSSSAQTRRINLAILSSEIGGHVVSMFLKSFLLCYDRSRVSVTAIVSRRRYEKNEEYMLSLCDSVLVLNGLPFAEALVKIKSHKFDIIVDTSGYTASTQLAYLAHRLAPVQCHYIGFHASTHLDTIDYFIGDEEITPQDAQCDFTESIANIPRTWLAISYHEELPIACSQAETSRLTFGSFNQFAKFTESTFDFWAAALNAVSGSLLLVKDGALSDQRAINRIVSALEIRGITKDRLRFMHHVSSWRDHMSIYNVIDVALDCTPWSGSTTAFDALSMGTPYLAIRGDCTSSRMSSSIVKGYGRPDWIAESPREYGASAAKLASELQRIRLRKAEMQSEVKASCLHDALDLTQCLQELFAELVSGKKQQKFSEFSEGMSFDNPIDAASSIVNL